MTAAQLEEIRCEGYLAGLRGARGADNPYGIGTDAYHAWRDGQSDGNDDAISGGA